MAAPQPRPRRGALYPLGAPRLRGVSARVVRNLRGASTRAVRPPARCASPVRCAHPGWCALLARRALLAQRALLGRWASPARSAPLRDQPHCAISPRPRGRRCGAAGLDSLASNGAVSPAAAIRPGRHAWRGRHGGHSSVPVLETVLVGGVGSAGSGRGAGGPVHPGCRWAIRPATRRPFSARAGDVLSIRQDADSGSAGRCHRRPARAESARIARFVGAERQYPDSAAKVGTARPADEIAAIL